MRTDLRPIAKLDAAAPARSAADARRWLWRLYLQSVVARVLVGLAAWSAMQFFDVGIVQDARYYEELGASIAAQWWSGQASTVLEDLPPTLPRLEIVFIAACYYVTFGLPALPVAIVAMAACVSLTPLVVYQVACELGASLHAARISARLVAFSPSFVFWAGAMYKEGPILLVLALILWQALRLQRTWSPSAIAGLCAGVIAMFLLRFYLAALLLVVLGGGLAVGRADTPGCLPLVLVRQALTIGLAGALIVFSGAGDLIRETLPDTLEDGFQQLQTSRVDLASTADSGYLATADVSTPGSALAFLPTGMAYFLVVPLPWQWGSLRQNLSIPETAVWVFLLYPLMARGWGRAWRRNLAGTLLLLGLALGLTLLYGLLSSNIGVAFRHRIQLWLVLAPLCGMGWDGWRSKVAQPEDALATPQPEPLPSLGV